MTAVMQVPDGYPVEGCGVELKSHNFPESVSHLHIVQVNEGQLLHATVPLPVE